MRDGYEDDLVEKIISIINGEPYSPEPEPRAISYEEAVAVGTIALWPVRAEALI